MENTEIFKDIQGYEGIYQVSNIGNVKSLQRYVNDKGGKRLQKERILKACADGGGYYFVALSKSVKVKYMKVHVLVSMAFLGHVPDGHNIVPNHKNGIKNDNRVENLELDTQRGNTSKYFLSKKTSSKYTGVCWNKKSNKWQSNIRIDGQKKHLGFFNCEADAHLAYEKALNNLLKSN
jgi:hypothetical protein